MIRVEVETTIAAPRECCFDMARNLNLHAQTTAQTRERVVSGPASGFVELNDEVTFEATHFGIKQRLSSRIVEYDRPSRFTDQMIRGAFQSLRHQHIFEEHDSGTKMIDILEFQSPFGFIGRLIDHFVLRDYMKRFLVKRNNSLKALAESPC